MRSILAVGVLIVALRAHAFVGGPGSLCRPQTFHRSPCSSGRLDRPAVRSLQSRGHVGGIGCSVTPESDTGTTSEEEEADDRPPLPDDPEIIEMMERAYYEKQKLKNDKVFQRLAALRHDLESIPMQKQCHRYRWRQTETMFDVEIPMPKPCEDDKLWLVVESEQLQVAVKTDETFGAVVGHFTGFVDPTLSSFRVHQRDGEPYVHLLLAKVSHEGTYELWRDLLQGEEESPTIRFSGKTNRYRWKQNAETIEVEIPVPKDVTKRRTNLEFDRAGAWMKLSFDGKTEFEPLEGKFKGLMSPLDSVWMLDEDSRGKMMALTIKKRRDSDDSTAWWSGVLEGDDKW